MILSEKLHSVTARFDQLRAIRFQDAINKRIPRRKVNRAANKNTSSVDSSKTNNLDFMEPDEIQPEPLRVQQQLLDDETRALQVIRNSYWWDFYNLFHYQILWLFRWVFEASITRAACCWTCLQVELTSLLDAVQETETKMVEMSALNHLMSTHVLQQAQQIELLYEQVSMSS